MLFASNLFYRWHPPAFEALFAKLIGETRAEKMAMISPLCLLFALIGLPVCVDESKRDPKAGGSALKGKWEITSASCNGNASPMLKGRILVFGDSEFTIYDGETKGRTITFTLDPKADPKQIDLNRDG